MSKRGYISRYLVLLKELSAHKHASYEQLKTALDRNIAYFQDADTTLEIGFSKRTLQRDIKEIRELFGIEIEYSATKRGYFISYNKNDSLDFQRRMEALDMLNSIHLSEKLSPYLIYEKRRALGTDAIPGLLHAIKHKLQIRFQYQKFLDEDVTERLVEPYVLKEFKHRWYVLAKDHKDGLTKSFALDRLSELQITERPFEFPKTYDSEESYHYCFGIISPEDGKPEEILLSMDPVQARYLKSLPLHHTQEVVLESETETQIKLLLYVTHDLVMELMSYGANEKVLKPASLADELRQAHYDAYQLYGK